MEGYRVLLVVDGVVDDGVVGKKFDSWIVLNIVREVINVDKEEERAENTSLGDSWGDVDGGSIKSIIITSINIVSWLNWY